MADPYGEQNGKAKGDRYREQSDPRAG